MKVYVKASKVFIGEPKSINILFPPKEAQNLKKRVSEVIKEKKGLRLVLYPKKKTIQIYLTDRY